MIRTYITSTAAINFKQTHVGYSCFMRRFTSYDSWSSSDKWMLFFLYKFRSSNNLTIRKFSMEFFKYFNIDISFVYFDILIILQFYLYLLSLFIYISNYRLLFNFISFNVVTYVEVYLFLLVQSVNQHMYENIIGIPKERTTVVKFE